MWHLHRITNENMKFWSADELKQLAGCFTCYRSAFCLELNNWLKRICTDKFKRCRHCNPQYILILTQTYIFRHVSLPFDVGEKNPVALLLLSSVSLIPNSSWICVATVSVVLTNMLDENGGIIYGETFTSVMSSIGIPIFTGFPFIKGEQFLIFNIIA